MIDTDKPTINDFRVKSRECFTNAEIAEECNDYQDAKLWRMFGHIVNRLEKLENAS